MWTSRVWNRVAIPGKEKGQPVNTSGQPLPLRYIALALVLTVSSSGCITTMFAVYAVQDAGHWREIRTGNAEWAGYVHGAVYQLQTDVFLADLKYYSHGLALAPGPDVRPRKRDPHWGGPATVREYRANPESWPGMQGIVDAGTRLRTTRLRKKVYAMGDVEAFVLYAEIMDGPYAGRTVEITELSLHTDRGKWPLKPNPSLLQLVEDSTDE